MASSLITRRSGGGLAGATLTVTAADKGIITITKQGTDKQRQKEISASDNYTAVFKGLSAGVWEVTHSAYNLDSLEKVTIGESIVISTFVAWIEVTYPEDSTCTCALYDENSGHEFKPDIIEQSDGYYKFEVHQEGVWRVSCSTKDESKSIEEAVPVTDGKTVSVNLAYTRMLFEENNQCKDFTGGWTYSGYKIPSGYLDSVKHSVKVDEKISVGVINNGYSRESNIAGTVNKVKLNNYKKLICDLEVGRVKKSTWGYSEFYVAISTTKSFDPKAESTIAMQSITSEPRQTVEISLDDCSSSAGYYIVLAALNNDKEKLWYHEDGTLGNPTLAYLYVYSIKAVV